MAAILWKRYDLIPILHLGLHLRPSTFAEIMNSYIFFKKITLTYFYSFKKENGKDNNSYFLEMCELICWQGVKQSPIK